MQWKSCDAFRGCQTAEPDHQLHKLGQSPCNFWGPRFPLLQWGQPRSLSALPWGSPVAGSGNSAGSLGRPSSQQEARAANSGRQPAGVAPGSLSSKEEGGSYTTPSLSSLLLPTPAPKKKKSTGEKSQVQGHLNVPEDKSHRGWQACDGSCGLHRIHTIVKDGYPGNLRHAALPSQPRDILRTAEQRPSGYCRSTLFPGGPRFLPAPPFSGPPD